MIKYTYTLVVGVALIFSSCGNETNQIESEVHTEHEHSSEDALQLDNGEKWVVNEEMMVHVQNMVIDLDQFENQKESDFNALATKLENNIDLLTASCTMSGKAHDELHKWLLPYIDLVSELSSAENDTEANATYTKIQTSFKTFNTYFK